MCVGCQNLPFMSCFLVIPPLRITQDRSAAFHTCVACRNTPMTCVGCLNTPMTPSFLVIPMTPSFLVIPPLCITQHRSSSSRMCVGCQNEHVKPSFLVIPPVCIIRLHSSSSRMCVGCQNEHVIPCLLVMPLLCIEILVYLHAGSAVVAHPAELCLSLRVCVCLWGVPFVPRVQ